MLNAILTRQPLTCDLLSLNLMANNQELCHSFHCERGNLEDLLVNCMRSSHSSCIPILGQLPTEFQSYSLAWWHMMGVRGSVSTSISVIAYWWFVDVDENIEKLLNFLWNLRWSVRISLSEEIFTLWVVLFEFIMISANIITIFDNV